MLSEYDEFIDILSILLILLDVKYNLNISNGYQIKTDIEIKFVANIIPQTMIVLNLRIKYINSACTTSILILLLILQLLVPGQVLKNGLRQHGNLRYIVCMHQTTNFREGHSFLLVSYLNRILFVRQFISISIIRYDHKTYTISSYTYSR